MPHSSHEPPVSAALPTLSLWGGAGVSGHRGPTRRQVLVHLVERSASQSPPCPDQAQGTGNWEYRGFLLMSSPAGGSPLSAICRPDFRRHSRPGTRSSSGQNIHLAYSNISQKMAPCYVADRIGIISRLPQTLVIPTLVPEYLCLLSWLGPAVVKASSGHTIDPIPSSSSTSQV